MAKQGGSSAKGRQHANHKGKYLKQLGRTAKNKEKAWKLHLANHPNDKRAATSIAIAKPKLTAYKSTAYS